jgi:hypothetical protein
VDHSFELLVSLGVLEVDELPVGAAVARCGRTAWPPEHLAGRNQGYGMLACIGFERTGRFWASRLSSLHVSQFESES